ncbi:MAG: homoserine dehydrogenase [Candidatus Nitrospinota bacterium M3_3B_026]
MDAVRVGMIGLGVVGRSVASLLSRRGEEIAVRVGAPVRITKIAVRDLSRKREADTPRELLTDDPWEVVGSPDVDIVLEVMGGRNPALDLTLTALENGKSVVTANKHLLAMNGEEIYAAVEESGVELGFEAAVAGAVPIIRALRSSFAGDRLESVRGLVNGTANYILTRMELEERPYDVILEEAQALGYAETDPSFDVEGIDSAHKIAILASLAFDTPVDFNDVYTEGLTDITPEDIMMAREFGYRVKLLAVARRIGDDAVDVRVHPTMIPLSAPIANVNWELNAVEVVGDFAGVNLMIGPGAGGGPTASAVVSDVVDIAGRLVRGGAGRTPPVKAPLAFRRKLAARSMDEVRSMYYLRFTVPDRPGVLARLSGALGEHDISIASMIQRGREANNGPVSVVLMTHTAVEADLKRALGEIESLGVLSAPTVTIRIEDGEE